MNVFFMGKNFNDLPTKIEEILSLQVDIRTFFEYDTSKKRRKAGEFSALPYFMKTK